MLHGLLSCVIYYSNMSIVVPVLFKCLLMECVHYNSDLAGCSTSGTWISKSHMGDFCLAVSSTGTTSACTSSRFPMSVAIAWETTAFSTMPGEVPIESTWTTMPGEVPSESTWTTMPGEVPSESTWTTMPGEVPSESTWTTSAWTGSHFGRG